jgi:hypothetical protein
MSKYTNETYRIVWRFMSEDTEYCVVDDSSGDDDSTYRIFCSKDIDEVAYTNFAIIKEYTRLNGKITDSYDHYVFTKDNFIHCETGPAICCPCGLDTFKVNQDIEDYLIYGKIFSQYSWLTWVKHSKSWPQAMANILGSKEK